MSILQLSKVKFKPQFLKKDQSWIDKRIETEKVRSKEIESALWETKKLFPTSQPDELIITAISGGWNGICALVQKLEKRPEGDSETILKLWGKHDHAIKVKELLSPNVVNLFQYRLEDFNVKDGKVTLSENLLNSINERATYYTTTEKQNERLRVCKNLANVLNEVIDGKYVYIDNNPTTFNHVNAHTYIEPLKKLVEVDNKRIQPNFYEIIRMKE